jgi:hypothetical protein
LSVSSKSRSRLLFEFVAQPFVFRFKQHTAASRTLRNKLLRLVGTGSLAAFGIVKSLRAESTAATAEILLSVRGHLRTETLPAASSLHPLRGNGTLFARRLGLLKAWVSKGSPHHFALRPTGQILPSKRPNLSPGPRTPITPATDKRLRAIRTQTARPPGPRYRLAATGTLPLLTRTRLRTLCPALPEERTLHLTLAATAEILLSKRTPLRAVALTTFLAASGKRLRAESLTTARCLILLPLHLFLDAIAYEFSNTDALLGRKIL